MKIKKYLRAESVEQAYESLVQNSGASLIAGGAWLKLLPTKIDTAIDLSGLGLDAISETGSEFSIGCMTTLRQLEKFDPFKDFYNGIVQKGAGVIMGVTIRNIATIGGTVAGRFGFSDLITPLMVLDTELEFYNSGRIPLETFMKSRGKEKDILLKIIISKREGRGWFYTMKNTAIDFPVLNAAVSSADGRCKIAVGARPFKAVLAPKAMEYINNSENITGEIVEKTAKIAAEEMKFGTNIRGSKEYRKELCRVIVKRGLTEVLL